MSVFSSSAERLATRPSLTPDEFSAAGPRSRGAVWLIAAGGLVLALGRFQLFPPPGWVDPGMYLGYFLNFSERVQRFGVTYHAMRLPWTLSGWLAHRVFAPVVAQYVLIAAYDALALLSVYSVVAVLEGSGAATFATLWLAWNPLWIASVTRGYVDGPAMSFMLLTFAALIRYRRGSPSSWVGMVCGGAAALALYTHPVPGILTLLGVAIWLWVDRGDSGVLPLLVWCAFGAAAVTLLLSFASFLLGGPLGFFLVAISVGPSTTTIGPWFQVSVLTWVPTAYRLLPAAALLGLSLATPSDSPRDRREPRKLLVFARALLLLTGTILLTNDVLARGDALQNSHYASYLLPGQSLLCGALAGPLLRSTSRNGLVWLAFVLGALVPMVFAERLWALEFFLRPAACWILLGAAFAGSGILFLRSRPIALAALGFATAVATTLNADTRRIFVTEKNPSYEPFYLAAVRLNDLIDDANLGRRPLHFWFNRNSFTTGDKEQDKWLTFRHHYGESNLLLNELDSLTAVFMWDRSNVGVDMPSLSHHLRQRVPPRSALAILCQDPSECLGGCEALRAAGVNFDVRIKDRIPISRGLEEHIFILYIHR